MDTILITAPILFLLWGEGDGGRGATGLGEGPPSHLVHPSRRGPSSHLVLPSEKEGQTDRRTHTTESIASLPSLKLSTGSVKSKKKLL